MEGNDDIMKDSLYRLSAAFMSVCMLFNMVTVAYANDVPVVVNTDSNVVENSYSDINAQNESQEQAQQPTGSDGLMKDDPAKRQLQGDVSPDETNEANTETKGTNTTDVPDSSIAQNSNSTTDGQTPNIEGDEAKNNTNVATFSLASTPSVQSRVDADSVEYTEGGITFVFETKSDGTATLTGIKNPENPVDVTVPSRFTHDGENYTVTAAVISGSTADNVTGLTLPDTLTEIGGSFSVFTSLKTISLPANITKIPTYTFYGCASLETVTAATDITEIGNYAFCDCPKLESIDLSKVTKMGSGAFWNCSSLETVNLSALGTIPYAGFYNCTNLTSVVHNGNIEKIDQFAFQSCEKLKTFEVSGYVKEICAQAFCYCSELQSFTAGGAVKKIGQWAFSDCEKLRSFTSNGDVDEITKYAFRNCESLTSFTVNGNVGKLDGNVFYDCTNLETVNITGDVTEINGAFSWCRKLKTVTIGGNLDKIGESAFYLCSGLESLNVAGTVKEIGAKAFYECEKLTTIPDLSKVTSMGDSAFNYCSSISGEVDLSSLTEIPSGAFAHCTKLESVKTSGTITKIGWTAFWDCENLTTVPDLSKVTSIGAQAFDGCSSLTSDIDLSSLSGTLPGNLYRGCSSLTKVKLSDDMTEIGWCAFQNCTKLKEITTNSSITVIGESAFENCENLENIGSIADLSKVTELDRNAFKNCKKLELDADLSSLTKIANSVFDGTPVKSVKFGDDLTYIGTNAFSNTKIASVTLPESLETIEKNAFLNTPLTGTVTIPSTVTSIGSSAFKGTSAKEFFVGSSVETVGSDAFANNGNLKKITVDNSRDNLNLDGYKSSTVDVIYLYESLAEGADDKISDEEDALTLQEAVNKARRGDIDPIIVIKKDIRLNTTLNIPAGKAITIKTAEGDDSFVIVGTLDNLINVAAGADVTFGGNLNISGMGINEKVIYNKGTVTLQDGVHIDKANLKNNNSGVIYNTDSTATLNIKSGCIENNKIRGNFSAPIVADKGAKVYVTGGTIQNNNALISDRNMVHTSSGGILLTESAHVEMSGGAIQYNQAYRGSAVTLNYTGSNSASKQPYFLLKDYGYITSNSSSTISSKNSAGAVYVHGNAKFEMIGGTISNNIGGMGGGVTVVDPGKLYSNSISYNATFIMSGGGINGNKAQSGGGIYSFADNVHLSAGYISGNTASNMGGGIYSEGNLDFDGSYGYVYLTNAYVCGNRATEQGGGLWLCPTGDAKVYVKNGGIIASNTAHSDNEDGTLGKSAGDDVVSAGSEITGKNFSLTLTDRVPGGGRIYWYTDGGVYNAVYGYSTYPSISSTVSRYNPNDSTAAPVTVKDETKSLALKAVISNEAFVLADTLCTLKITGNTAIRGGGIGANGGVVIGEDTAVRDIRVEKLWDHGVNPENKRPTSITVNLVNKTANTIIETAKLTRENGWKFTFAGLPVDIEYEIKEDAVDNYSSTITYYPSESSANSIATDKVTITNVYTPELGNLTVSKTVTGAAGDHYRSFKFRVTLDNPLINGEYGDMKFENGVAEFYLIHGQSVTAIGLPEETGYKVEELNNGNYTVGKTGDVGFIKANETVLAEFINNKDVPTNTQIPNTGTDNNPYLWVAVMVLCLAVVGGIQIFKKVKSAKTKNS